MKTCLFFQLFSSIIDRPASLATTPTNKPATTSTKTNKATTVTRLRQKPALSASESALNNKNLDETKNCLTNSSCCDCFPSPKKRWSDSGSAQMSDIYIGKERRSESDFSTPACLNNMNTRKSQNLLSIESEIEFRGSLNKKNGRKTGSLERIKKSPNPNKKSVGKETKNKVKTPRKKTKNYEIELADEACAESDDPETFVDVAKEEKPHISHVNGKHDIIIVEERNNKNKHSTTRKLQKSISIAQESITSSDKSLSSPSNTLPRPKGINRFFTYNRNKQNKINENVTNSSSSNISNTQNNQETSFITPEPTKCEFQLALDGAMQAYELMEADLNGNPKIVTERNCNTLPKMKKSHFHPSILYSRDTNRTPFKVPKRTTTDGTTIYYWCDVPKKQIKGLLLMFYFVLFM